MAATDNVLKLLKFQVDSFAKIDKSKPVVIVWDDKRIVTLEADQEQVKTSIIKAFESLCGLPIPDNAVNKVDNNRKTSLDFEKNGKKYAVTITKTRFEVELMVEEGKWAKLSSPKSVLLDVLGPVGVSPMFLKDYDGKKQIEWLRSFYNPSEEEIKLEQDLEARYKSAYEGRRDAKKEYLKYEKLFKESFYFPERELWESKIEAFNKREIKDVTDIQKKYNTYQRAKQEVDMLVNEQLPSKKTELENIDLEIKELEEKLKAAIARKESKIVEIQNIDNRISKGNEFIEENKEIVAEYESIVAVQKYEKEMEAIIIHFNAMLENEKQYNHFTEEYTRLQNILDEVKKAKKEFIAAITPNIEGFEVCVPDEENTREGLFYNGYSPLELSESELWGFYLKLLQALNIRVVVIENISSLGSKAIEMLNYYAENGGYILGSLMNRAEKNLKVTVQDKFAE